MAIKYTDFDDVDSQYQENEENEDDPAVVEEEPVQIDDKENGPIYIMSKKPANQLKSGNWVCVEYKGKWSTKRYIGQIIDAIDNNFAFNIKFLKQKDNNSFFWPEDEDVDEVPCEIIMGVLKEPNFSRRGILIFNEKI